MHPDVALGDRYHRPAFRLVSNLIEDLMDQRGDVATAKPFSSDADHRRSWPFISSGSTVMRSNWVFKMPPLTLSSVLLSSRRVGRGRLAGRRDHGETLLALKITPPAAWSFAEA